MATVTEDPAVVRRRRLLDYIREIETLCREDAGVRTALRSGLRRGLDDVPRMHRYVAGHLPRGARTPEHEQRAYYAIAAMIAAQPRSRYTEPADDTAPSGTPEAPAGPDEAESSGTAPRPTPEASSQDRYGPSLGEAFALAVSQGPDRDRTIREATAESRLNLLTRQSLNGLHRHLPAAVGYLREVGVPVDWAQLLSDLTAWPAHSKQISRRWLQHYHSRRTKALHAKADTADLADLADQQEPGETGTEPTG